MNKELAKIERQLEEKRQRKKALEDKEKVLAKQMSELTRKARTHRLCTRGAQLEQWLKNPERWSEEDVEELLAIAFKTEAVAQKVKQVLER